jgi:ABC-type lipoprotein export system ATPase subunit
VLIGQFSVAQNIAMSFTLAVDPIDADVLPRVNALAEEVGLSAGVLTRRVAETDPEVQNRVRLARALALRPSLLVAEHPSAGLPRASVERFATDLGGIARARGLAVLAVTADEDFVKALDGLKLILEPATGTLRAQTIWNKVLRRFTS